MSTVYNVPVVIGVDEKRIAEEIEKDVKAQVVASITKDIKETIFNKRNYYSDVYDDPTPIRDMAKKIIKDLIDGHKDEIIQGAIKELTVNMMKTKVVKEAVKNAVEESK